VVLAAVLTGVFMVVIGRLFYWQVVQHDDLSQAARVLSTEERVIHPRRGRILDRHDNVLAMDVVKYNISANPNQVSDRWEAADFIAPLLGDSRQRIWEVISGEEPYVVFARHMPSSVGEAILLRQEEGDLGGIIAEPLLIRAYPEGDPIEPLMGFVDYTEERSGHHGIEGFYNDRLRGLPGTRHGDRDVYGGDIVIDFPEYAPAVDGANLVLTLDRYVQYISEMALAKAIEENQAEGGLVIVMVPKTGEILAMAAVPSYDPNNFATEPVERYANAAVSGQYEPGSVFKVITVAAGLDSGSIAPQTVIDDPGTLLVSGRPIYNWDHKGHGQVTIAQVLSLSLNVGVAKVSTGFLGKDLFYEYVKRFGFGEATGIDLAAEVRGSVRMPVDPQWREIDLATNSFGQGIAVTPIQMITAVSAIANGGFLMRPYVVESILDDDGIEQTQPEARRRVISQETAWSMTNMLAGVIEEEATLAAVEGCRMAGKTGTAQIPIPGGYANDETIASFVGYGPISDPQFVILVKVDKPQKSPWGSEVAAPVFQEIAEQLVIHFGIPPDDLQLASSG
jgi:cell division protein FtsI/penicillin-binding protein 2